MRQQLHRPRNPSPFPRTRREKRAAFEQRCRARSARRRLLGGPDFAAAKNRASESIGANDAGSPQLADKRLNEASRLLGLVESRATQAMNSQLAAARPRSRPGRAKSRSRRFESARLIDPNNKALAGRADSRAQSRWRAAAACRWRERRSRKGLCARRAGLQPGLSLDSNNARARAGWIARMPRSATTRTRRRSAPASHRSAPVGSTMPVKTSKGALHAAERPEAQTGLTRRRRRAARAGFASTRQKGAGLEGEEALSEAAAEYDAALKVDPSLVFASRARPARCRGLSSAKTCKL